MNITKRLGLNRTETIGFYFAISIVLYLIINSIYKNIYKHKRNITVADKRIREVKRQRYGGINYFYYVIDSNGREYELYKNIYDEITIGSNINIYVAEDLFETERIIEIL